MEATYALLPMVAPESVRSLIASSGVQRERVRVVEYLPDSPFAKFRPNVLARSLGFHGPDDTYEYEWRTDSRGFKNMPEMARREHVAVVCVGDSYTEGLGVRTEETWSSLLSRDGYPSYSLGVQGYAPSQAAGVFRHHGLALEPEIVIVGYLSSTFDREESFINGHEIPSAMGRAVAADRLETQRRLGSQCRFFVEASYVYSRNLALTFRRRMRERMTDRNPWDPRFVTPDKLRKDNDIGIGVLQRYRQEILPLADTRITRGALESKASWHRALNAFREIKGMSDAVDAQVLLVFFSMRGAAYYEKATGYRLPGSSHDAVEYEALRDSCESIGIDIINVGEAFISYVNSLPDDAPISRYPYLEYDGHPSRIGHRIIADVIEDHLRVQLP